MSSPPALPPTGRPIEAHRIEFTGSGSEYFRVWVVNLLLLIVTLGLYTPWARRRTAQYFYGHTQVAGSPLEFVAEARRMALGFLLFAALYAAYELALQTGQDLAASLLFFGFAALLPLLWGSAMRFRLAATRWRGIRLGFTASWKEVDLASGPVFAIAAVWIAAFFVAATLLADPAPGDAPLPAWKKPSRQEIGALLGLFLAALLPTLLCLIRLEYNYKRLLVARARIGGQVGRWKPVFGDFVRVWLAAVGVFVLTLLGFVLGGAALGSVWVYLLGALLRGTGILGMFLAAYLGLLGVLLAIVLASLPARAYREARMFRLVWSQVGFDQLARSRCDLRTGAYVGLRVKNVLLSFLTLGLYRPFAIASEYAAKVQSVTLHVKGSAGQLEAELVRQQGAFGDAAADALGLDLIG